MDKASDEPTEIFCLMFHVFGTILYMHSCLPLSHLNCLWISRGACYCLFIFDEGKINLLVHSLAETENHELMDFQLYYLLFVYLFLIFSLRECLCCSLSIGSLFFLPKFCHLIFILTFKQVFNKNLDIFSLLPISCWPFVWGPAYFLNLQSLCVLDC